MQHQLHGERNNQDGTAETHDQSVSDRFGNASQQASRWANQSFYIDVFTVQEDAPFCAKEAGVHIAAIGSPPVSTPLWVAVPATIRGASHTPAPASSAG